MKLIKNGLWALLLVLFAVSCKEDDITPDDAHEEEVITTVKYILTNVDDESDVATFVYTDMDDDGDTDEDGDTLIIDSLLLGATYSGEIILLNDLEDEVDTVSKQILAEGDLHEFYFALTDAGDLTIEKTDEDKDGNPIGLKTEVVIGSTAFSAATLSITLLHEPEKGDEITTIEEAGGEEDVDLDFTGIKTYTE